jgi:hypothetical protein
MVSEFESLGKAVRDAIEQELIEPLIAEEEAREALYVAKEDYGRRTQDADFTG